MCSDTHTHFMQTYTHICVCVYVCLLPFMSYACSDLRPGRAPYTFPFFFCNLLAALRLPFVSKTKATHMHPHLCADFVCLHTNTHTNTHTHVFIHCHVILLSAAFIALIHFPCNSKNLSIRQRQTSHAASELMLSSLEFWVGLLWLYIGSLKLWHVHKRKLWECSAWSLRMQSRSLSIFLAQMKYLCIEFVKIYFSLKHFKYEWYEYKYEYDMN